MQGAGSRVLSGAVGRSHVDQHPTSIPFAVLMGSFSKLVTELRRRGVHRTTALYLAGAWLAIQVSDTVFPRLGLPDGAVTALVWLAVLGLPVAMVLAWSFDVTRRGPRRHRPHGPPVRRRAAGWTAAVVVAMAAAGAGTWALRDRTGAAASGPEPEGFDADVVAVLPFRVSGADDRLAYLREGMVDLMSTKLTGQVGPRAVDPGTVMSAWRRLAGSSDADLPEDSALAVARMVGAGRALVGSVVGTPGAMVLTVTVRDAADGRGGATASVAGPADSVAALVDRAVATVLSLEAGQDGSRLAALTGTSLPALRAYLAGESAYRRGAYEDALERFDQALVEDSTFAMAGLGLFRAAGWIGGAGAAGDRGAAVAWANRDRLSPRDRAYLTARLGPTSVNTSSRELLAAREDALALMPDRAEMWYELADFHFHYGWLLGDRDAMRRALEGFVRALELDPGFSGPLQHAVTAAAVIGDSARVRDLAERYAGDRPDQAARYVRWRAAVFQGDTAALARIREDMATWPSAALRHVAVDVQDSRLPVEDAVRALTLREQRPATMAERLERQMGLHALALNRGRPAEAARILAATDPPREDPGLVARTAILAALHAEGDLTAAARAAATLEARLAAAGDRGRTTAGAAAGLADSVATDAMALDRCVLAQWKLGAGDGLRPGDLNEVRALRADGLPWSQVLPSCVGLVEAMAAAPGTAARRTALERLESLLLEAPYRAVVDLYDPYLANLALARFWDAEGEPARALDTVRRRIFFHGWVPYATVSLQAEARLAEALGQHDDAILAYRRYLNLRDDPETGLVARADSAQAALDRLIREG
jgi:tetratricopeptide (TPR) repeat protein